MKKHVLIAICGLALLMALSGCTSLIEKSSVETPRLPQAISEDAEIIIPEAIETVTDEVEAQYYGSVHYGLTYDAGTYWGLSSTRKSNMAAASKKPDEYQTGISSGFNQQWSHAYLWSSFGTWIWGDADDDFHDNIDQSTGELESPEGYNNKSAKYYYTRGDQTMGDWYLGYAVHYIEDVSLMLHATDPTSAMLTNHSNFEKWIANNWTSGHNFKGVVANDSYYYTVSDLKQSIKNASKAASYWTSSLGKDVWDAYKASGYPTSAGTGNSTLVSKAKTMLIRSARYTRGTIKYTLDKYNQW